MYMKISYVNISNCLVNHLVCKPVVHFYIFPMTKIIFSFTFNILHLNI